MNQTFNDEQQQAIAHSGGPLLIVAGAGTGKTTVITQRIKYLLQQKKVSPGQIFTATFTEKSAQEMEERLDKVMPFGYEEPWLGTFHGLADRLLRTEGLEIGYNPNFTIMTQTDQWIFIKKHLYDFDLDYYRPLGNPNKFITALIKVFSRLQDENVSNQEFAKTVQLYRQQASDSAQEKETERLDELYHAYRRYQELKQTESVLDFGDLITTAIKLLRDRPNLRQKYQSQFQYLLVDEFQDTNYAQFELIKLLAPPESHPNLMVVGDDDQAIYKFRGASVSNILEFKTIYPEAQEIVLTKNYRSTQAILDSAYHSIVHNNPDRLEVKLSLDKKLQAQTSKTGIPQLVKFGTEEDEVDWVVKEIISLVTKEGLTYKDIAILARSNAQLDAYVLALKNAGLPYQLVSNRGLFDQEEVSLLLTYLKVLADPEDTLALFQLAQSRLFDLEATQLLQLISTAKKFGRSLWEQMRQDDHPDLKSLIERITSFQQLAKEKSITNLIYTLISQSNYLAPFLETETVENQLKIKNLNLFFNHLKRFERVNDDKSLIGFLSVLDLWLEAGENPGQAQIEDIDTVSLMTVHGAKGLEFSAVFVTGLIAGRFPSRSRKDPIEIPPELIKETLPEGNEQLQEERRLFYVALTRAKTHLYLTFAEDVGGARKRKMSGFLAETGLPLTTVPSETAQLPLLATPRAPEVRYLESGQYTIRQVSHTQLETFKKCPLQYKYRYLLQLPAQSSHALSFGQTMHQTLHQFHLRQMQGNPMTLKELLETYQNNFIETGYGTPQAKKIRYDSGYQALKDYFKKHQSLAGEPIKLEQSFSLMIGDVKLTGKIDRIDRLPSGEYEIIDYKTGQPKDQKKVDKDDQLTIYALAAQESLGINPDALSLYFLEKGGQKVTTARTPKQLAKAKEKISTQIEAIKQSSFPAKPNPVKCGFCEYVTLCPFASKKSV